MIIIIIIVLLIAVVVGGYFWMQSRPVDCVVSTWAPWGSCSKTCGGGTTTRTRTITTQPKNNGKVCPSLTDTSSCNTQPCPINCVGDWGPWGTCEGSCGMGKTKRYYKVTTAAANSGLACPFRSDEVEEKDCNTMVACQVQPSIAVAVPQSVYNKVRIHNTWSGGFVLLYHTADWDTMNKNMIINIFNDLNNKKSFKITNIYAVDNSPLTLTDNDNQPIPSIFNVTEITRPADQPDTYTYVTVRFTPEIVLKEHKLLDIII